MTDIAKEELGNKLVALLENEIDHLREDRDYWREHAMALAEQLRTAQKNIARLEKTVDDQWGRSGLWSRLFRRS